MIIRSFLAVEMAAELSASAATIIRNLASAGQAVNWVDPDVAHLTLKFFGEIDELKTYEISKAVEFSIRQYQPFPICVEGLGAFPSIDRPRTVWVGVSTGNEELIRLQSEIDEALGDLGYPKERRKFHPHITLGRVRDRVGQRELVTVLREWQEYKCGTVSVESAVLFRSELHRGGPMYTKLATCPLGGPPHESM